ncbi:MAG: hypothetical protein ACREQ8_05145 [Woeseiaceae bacterium]
MSYDLLFLSDSEQSIPDRDLFREHFARRAFYQVGQDQAVYENPDTGVYFIFDLVSEALEDEPPSWLAFTLNFYRPHYFALEAVPELQAVIDRTSGMVLDPQDGDPAPRPFSTEQFLKNWNHGNEQAYRIMPEEERKQGLRSDHLAYSTSLLEGVWRWNWNRQRQQGQLGDDVFVPRISFISLERKVQSTAVWTDAIPVHLPEVDTVLIYRDELRKRQWFGGFGGAPDLALVPWRDLEARLLDYPREDGSMPFRNISYPRAPEPLTDYLRSLPPVNPKPSMLAMDSVLNAELFAG